MLKVCRARGVSCSRSPLRPLRLRVRGVGFRFGLTPDYNPNPRSRHSSDNSATPRLTLPAHLGHTSVTTHLGHDTPQTPHLGPHLGHETPRTPRPHLGHDTPRTPRPHLGHHTPRTPHLGPHLHSSDTSATTLLRHTLVIGHTSVTTHLGKPRASAASHLECPVASPESLQSREVLDDVSVPEIDGALQGTSQGAVCALAQPPEHR